MGRFKKEKIHLRDKYNELVWALHFQGYNNEDIGYIMNRNRSVILNVVKIIPKGWQPKWKKVE